MILRWAACLLGECCHHVIRHLSMDASSYAFAARLVGHAYIGRIGSTGADLQASHG